MMKQQQKIIFDSKVSEIEPVYKSKVKAVNRLQVRSSKDAANIFRQHWNENTLQLQEEMKVMYLNRANHLLGIYTASKGSMTATLIDCKLILLAAFRLGAVFCLACHNHPSGSLKPSKADKLLTNKLKMGAALVDIHFLDHLIITADDYYSFAEEGLI